MVKVPVLILCVLSLSVVGQTPKRTPNNGWPDQTFKFEEFTDAGQADWKQRLDRFASVRMSYPDAALYINIYAKLGESRRSIDDLKNRYRDYFDQLDRGRDGVFINSGGYRKQGITTELWIIAKDGRFPQPTPDEPFSPERVDDLGDISDEEFKARLGQFWIKFFADDYPAYMINYGSDSEIARREELIVGSSNFRRFDRPRITLVRGGEAGVSRTVIWIVPPGAENPTP